MNVFINSLLLWIEESPLYTELLQTLALLHGFLKELRLVVEHPVCVVLRVVLWAWSQVTARVELVVFAVVWRVLEELVHLVPLKEHLLNLLRLVWVSQPQGFHLSSHLLQ